MSRLEHDQIALMRWKKSIHQITPCLIAGVMTCSSWADESEPPLLSLSTGDLEARLLAIDTELDELAHYSLRSGLAPSATAPPLAMPPSIVWSGWKSIWAANTPSTRW
tara:strand:- start:1179 stop:1502 length:324 start_codon:yes stop_codon:yes gene_type:complete